MVSRHDAVLAAIPVPAVAGAGVSQVTGETLPVALGLVGASLIVGHELFVVGVPE